MIHELSFEILSDLRAAHPKAAIIRILPGKKAVVFDRADDAVRHASACIDPEYLRRSAA